MNEKMILYNYNPNLPKPFCWVHPLKVDAVMSIAHSEFPAGVQSLILFGGALDLSCDGQSDIDLYAIVEDHYFSDDAEERLDNLKRVLRDVIKKSSIKYDLLVSSAEDFSTEAGCLGTVESKICNKGVRIYAK